MLTREEIEIRVRQLGEVQPWWHDIELPYGIRTCPRPGRDLQANHNRAKLQRISSHMQVMGKRVLDLACNEGFFSIEMLRLGASEVVGIDINEDRITKARFVTELLQLDNLRLVLGDVYQLAPEQLGGRFDVILCLGLLHRVPDPFGLIGQLARLGDTAILEWVGLESDEPVMKFWTRGDKQYDVHNSGYWKISRQCVREMAWRCGFRTHCDIPDIGSRAAMLVSRSREAVAGGEDWRLLESSLNDRERSYQVGVAQRLAGLVPPGSPLILVDQNWLDDCQPPGVRLLPFLERNGQYWGAPRDDAQAIAELERMRGQGAEFIAFVTPTLWWLDYYQGFRDHLRSSHSCCHESEELTLFDLR